VNHIYVSLLYCVSSVFYFRICFILFLHDPIFSNMGKDIEMRLK
jgi:hypothetical protein